MRKALRLRYKRKRIRNYYRRCPFCQNYVDFPDSGECPSCGETS